MYIYFDSVYVVHLHYVNHIYSNKFKQFYWIFYWMYFIYLLNNKIQIKIIYLLENIIINKARTLNIIINKNPRCYKVVWISGHCNVFGLRGQG